MYSHYIKNYYQYFGKIKSLRFYFLFIFLFILVNKSKMGTKSPGFIRFHNILKFLNLKKSFIQQAWRRIHAFRLSKGWKFCLKVGKKFNDIYFGEDKNQQERLNELRALRTHLLFLSAVHEHLLFVKYKTIIYIGMQLFKFSY